MNGPKLVVVGAGSYFFGRPVIWKMVKSEVLCKGTLALVDTDPDRLRTMIKIGEKAIAAAKAPTKLTGSTNRREVLKGADFVVLTFSFRNAYFRGLDCKVSKKFGVPLREGKSIKKEIEGEEITLSRAFTTARWTFIVDGNGEIVFKNTEVNAANDGKGVLQVLRAASRARGIGP